MNKSQVSSTEKTIRNPTLLLGKQIVKKNARRIKTTNNKTPTSYTARVTENEKKNISVIEKNNAQNIM